jgi:hypothetical protein
LPQFGHRLKAEEKKARKKLKAKEKSVQVDHHGQPLPLGKQPPKVTVHMVVKYLEHLDRVKHPPKDKSHNIFRRWWNWLKFLCSQCRRDPNLNWRERRKEETFTDHKIDMKHDHMVYSYKLSRSATYKDAYRVLRDMHTIEMDRRREIKKYKRAGKPVPPRDKAGRKIFAEIFFSKKSRENFIKLANTTAGSETKIINIDILLVHRHTILDRRSCNQGVHPKVFLLFLSTCSNHHRY